MKRSICELIKSLDIFGYPVTFYFLNQSNVKKSIFGALVTIILALLSLGYMSMTMTKFINTEYQTLQQTDFSLDLQDHRDLELRDDTFRFFYVLRKPQGLTEQESNDIEKYLKLQFIQIEEDWNKD